METLSSLNRLETLIGIDFHCETSILSTPLTSLSINRRLQEIICSRDYDVMVGVVWYLRGAESFVFSQLVAQCKVLNFGSE